MSKPRRKLMGGPVIDDRGNSTWQWGATNGGEIETEKVQALADGLSLEKPNEPTTLDPYNQAISEERDKPKRRSLDDMRRLNDQMKREHADLVKRLRNRISEPLARVSGCRDPAEDTARAATTPMCSPVQSTGSNPASGMRLRLRFDDRELLVDDSRSGISIGRAEDNDVVVRSDRASRLHARIEISGNRFVLIDLSANGTYVQ
ncbi:MAG TPA: FHA domain-containing protein, partial [Steroidobacteraceae bacterium]